VLSAPGLELVGLFRQVGSAALVEIGQKLFRRVPPGEDDIVSSTRKRFEGGGTEVTFELAAPRKWRYRGNGASRGSVKDLHSFTVYLLDQTGRCLAIRDSPFFHIESAWGQDVQSVARPFRLNYSGGSPPPQPSISDGVPLPPLQLQQMQKQMQQEEQEHVIGYCWNQTPHFINPYANLQYHFYQLPQGDSGNEKDIASVMDMMPGMKM